MSLNSLLNFIHLKICIVNLQNGCERLEADDRQQHIIQAQKRWHQVIQIVHIQNYAHHQKYSGGDTDKNQQFFGQAYLTVAIFI